MTIRLEKLANDLAQAHAWVLLAEGRLRALEFQRERWLFTATQEQLGAKFDFVLTENLKAVMIEEAKGDLAQAITAKADAKLALHSALRTGWMPVNTAPCDGRCVVLGRPDWDGVVTREFYSEADRDAKLASWQDGPTHWMRPSAPEREA
ncbi:hypothetical protein [Caulobacter sp. X]|uniref:hypothetical protein n=1 Tax=Caulobacter sp. X TaxID=2048901 RepID=UPI000C147A64|nr:hypothetical protein [Caulobacter sp. X]PIB96483.1 hypothetical protein CSW60_18415 [Caulobacter sp. X]